MVDFLQRLKQRKLVQWTLAYLAAAWVLLQVLDLAAGSYHWPDTVMHIAFAVLALGFVVALVLAWYHGERGAQRVTGAELLLIALVLAVGGGLLWHFGRIGSSPATTRDAATTGASPPALVASGSGPPVAAPSTAAASPLMVEPIAAQPIPAKSVAVLPFENLSTDKGNAYFADGMQDLILTKLADIGDLKVISRTSTEKYKSHPDDLKTVGQQLGVATILEGSVQKAGNQVLINVQLIDAKTDSHIWAQSYTRTLTNIFGIEGEVAEKVADALKAKLTSAESARVANVPTTNAAAFNAFLQGKYAEDHSFNPNGYRTAADYYRKAATEDPKFLLAWARLAIVLSGKARYSNSTTDAAQAKSALDHALALAPDSPEVRMAQGWYLDYVEKDLDGALAAFAAVARSQANNAQALFGVGVMHAHKGQWQDALGYLQKAVALAPRDTNLLQELAQAYTALRRYAEAVQTARRNVAIDPNDALGWARLAHAYEFMGDPASAVAAYQEAPPGVRANPFSTVNWVHAEVLQRNYVAASKLLAGLKPAGELSMDVVESMRGDVERLAGNAALAREHYLRAKALLEARYKQEPNPNELWVLGYLSARLGQREQALAQIALSNREDAAKKQFNPFFGECDDKDSMAQFQALLGNAGEAVKALDWLLARPAGNFESVPLLKIDPTWDPIRHDPRFQALLKKYGDAAPASAATVAGLREQG
jgi:TolB-like protein/Tfp pilus assembly protein PilF